MINFVSIWYDPHRVVFCNKKANIFVPPEGIVGRAGRVGFLPILLAFSFLIFWNFGLVDNPAFMVRLNKY